MNVNGLTQSQINSALLSNASLSSGLVTYSIANTLSTWSDYEAGTQPDTGYGRLNSGQASAFRGAIDSWRKVINVTFSELNETASTHGQIRVAFTSYQMAGSAGYAFYPTAFNGVGSDVWISNSFVGDDMSKGTFGFELFIHELGHALGLKHSFEDPALPTQYDNTRYTVMSYTDPVASIIWSFFETGNGGISSSGQTVAVGSPMVIDIAAAQSRYGANPNTAVGDTVYTFTQGATYVETIYDAGGVDTFDLSNFTRRVAIDLAPGSYSSLGIFTIEEQITAAKAAHPGFSGVFFRTVLDDPQTYTWTDNLGIALSTTIENATGGSADDNLVGNSAANRLSGGGGADQLFGQDGNDSLNGNAGADKLVGGHGDDRLFGDDGDDTLFGEGGNDTLVGGFGNDVLYGQDGNDTLFGEYNDDRMIAGLGDDLLYGQDGNDTLFGEGGNDQLVGGAGADTLYGQDGTDVLFGETGNDFLFGASGNDRLYGQDGNDTLQGETGDDIMDGGLGSDFLVGGGGSDSLNGGANGDVFLFTSRGEAADILLDFNAAEGDKIAFKASEFGAPAGFQLTAGVGFLSGAGVLPNAATATVYFDTASKALWYDIDGTGAAGANVIAFLTNTPALSASDFLFI
jgi:serralysin